MLPRASVVTTASPIDCSVTWARSFSLNSARSAALRCVMSVIVPSKYSGRPSPAVTTTREFSMTTMTRPERAAQLVLEVADAAVAR